MSRSRNVKPGFFKNENLAECTPWARLCFVGLWTMADREGRLEDRPRRIKGELFAYDNVEVEPLLQELEKWQFIIRYEAGGMNLIQVAQFTKHQNPHHREMASVLPAPTGYTPEPEAEDPMHEPKASGLPEAGPTCEGGSAVLIPDSGFLIPDSGFLKPKEEAQTRKRATPPARPEGVTEQTWNDWLQLRRAKKAPVTQTVLESAGKEAQSIGWSLEKFLVEWVSRGSQGLKAEWIRKDLPNQPPRENDYVRRQREVVEALAPRLSSRRPSGPAPHPDFIDMEESDGPARILG